MPTNFTPTSVVKAAVRKFTTPIISAATFDANIAALRAVENPLGATDYQTAGETIPGVAVADESYKATIDYLTPEGKVCSSISLAALTRKAYDDLIAEILASTAITSHYGAGTIADHNAVKDIWNVRLKVHDPTGEGYQLDFSRKSLRLSSYENEAILTKVDTWADSVTALN